MGTVATINLRNNEGETVHVMTYHNGFVGHTGAMLVAFYNSFEKAKALMKYGDLNSLEPKLPTGEFIDAVEREVFENDISKVPAYPYTEYSSKNAMVAAIKKSKNIGCREDYVISRFGIEDVSLPVYYIEYTNARRILHFQAKEEAKWRAKTGLEISEYTYLFDQKQGTWFLLDDKGKVISTVIDELKRINNGDWTVKKYLSQCAEYKKQWVEVLDKLKSVYAEMSKGTPRVIKDKVCQKPSSVRGINDWLRRVGAGGTFRVRTLQEDGNKYLAIQRFTEDFTVNKWKVVKRLGVYDYGVAVDTLSHYVPVDWQ